MKKILSTLLIIFFLIVNINFTYWLDESNKTVNYLIDYVNTKKNDLIKMQKKYDLQDDIEINLRLNKLKEINRILLRTSKTWEYNTYISQIVEQLKQNNNLIKENLKQKIEEKKIQAYKYKIFYYQKINPILNKIDNIVKNIAKKLMKKEKYNSKDKQIISKLVLIKNKIDNLYKLTGKNFNTKKDLREYIMYNFKQITNNFGQIKNIIKSTN